MKLRLLIVCLFTLFQWLSAHETDSKTTYPFTENKGQWNENVKFKTEIEGATIFFENNAFHYQFISRPNYHAGNIPDDNIERGHIFKARFLQSNQSIEISKTGVSDFYFNYYLGNNKSKWKSEVKSYQKIKYSELYPGVDLEVYSKSGFIKYDYIIKPGFSTDQIQIQYEGVKQPTVKDGNLIISHKLGEMIEEKPYAYQVINDKKTTVICNYRLNEEGILQFEFPKGYNTNYKLIIDPRLIFSTYSGSVANNFGETATYDDLGNGYMGGITSGTQYVTTLGAFQRSYAGGDWDIAISKFTSNGSTLLYSTYLGGTDNETVHSMVVDVNFNLYVFGATNSSNFPTTLNAFDRTLASSSSFTSDIGVSYANGADIIITKFNSAGTQLLGSTFYGGTGIDGINQNPSGGTTYDGLNFNYGDSHRGEIVVDSLGNCYVGTTTTTDNLPNTKGSYGGSQDGLILKFSPNLNSLIWSRYVGGSRRDAIYSLKVIDSNKVLIGGGTTSYSDFPITTGSYQDVSIQNTSSTKEEADGFISIISQDGNNIEKSTFISTPNYDQVYFIEFDRFNNVYGYGQTQGGTFPLLRAPKADFGAGQFIVKLDKNLDSLEFSTTFGNGANIGRVNISPTAFLVDRCQNIYAAGWGGSIRPGTNGEGAKSIVGMPLKRDSAYGPINDNAFYLYVINRDIDSLLFATFIGGDNSDDHVDGGTSRFDKNGVIYHSVCASCGSPTNDFPTSNSAYSTRDNSNGGCNNALFKIDFEIVVRADFTTSQTEICLVPGEVDSVIVSNKSVGATNITWDFYGDTIVSEFTDSTIYFTQPGIYPIRQVVFDSICALGGFLNDTIIVRPDDININIQFDSLVCYSATSNIVVNTNAKATEFRFSRSMDFSSPVNPDINDSIFNIQLTPGNNLYYILTSDPSRNACEKTDSILIFYNPTSINATLSANSVCENVPIQFNANVTNVDTFLWKFGNGVTNSTLNPQYTYPSAGTYPVYFVYENRACNGADSILFNVQIVNNDLQITSSQDTLFCGTGDLTVSLPSSGTITNYQYSSNINFTDQLNPSGSDNFFTINQDDSSLYYLKISNNFCEKVDSFLLEYINYSLDLSAITDSACIPHTEVLQANVIGADSFKILTSNGITFTNNPTPLLVFTQEGNYNVKLLASNERCNRIDSIEQTITILENVELLSIPDTLLCEGDSVRLTGNSNGTAKSFTWSTRPDFSDPISTPFDSIITVTPSNTLNYYLRGENLLCFDVDTVLVNVENLEIDVTDFESFCIYDTIDIRASVIQASSPLQYSWTPVDSILSRTDRISIQIAPLVNQFYYLETLSLTGCKDSDTVEVEVNLPAFDDAILFGADSLFKGQQSQLSTNRNGSNLTYQWEPVEDLDNPNSATPNATLNTSKTYSVTITDENTGCVVIASKRLKVFEVNCAEPDIFIPSAFSPNGDLTNDILYVRGANIRELEFQLFNRWGELVFETTDINTGWNGRYNGKQIDPGVFVYQVKAICFDGQEFIDKGNITLLR